jgi:hypothetical protein
VRSLVRAQYGPPGRSVERFGRDAAQNRSNVSFGLPHGAAIIADVFSVSHTLPVRRVAELPVRLRCLACEVAWSGPQRSECWVCGQQGTALNTAIAARDRTVSAFDLELLF